MPLTPYKPLGAGEETKRSQAIRPLHLSRWRTWLRLFLTRRPPIGDPLGVHWRQVAIARAKAGQEAARRESERERVVADCGCTHAEGQYPGGGRWWSSHWCTDHVRWPDPVREDGCMP